jgi:Flp pilus assembly protein TadB
MGGGAAQAAAANWFQACEVSLMIAFLIFLPFYLLALTALTAGAVQLWLWVLDDLRERRLSKRAR